MTDTREMHRRIAQARSALISALHALEKAEQAPVAAGYGIIALVHLSHVPGVGDKVQALTSGDAT